MRLIIIEIIKAVAIIAVAWITARGTAQNVVQESVGVIHCMQSKDLFGSMAGTEEFIFDRDNCNGKLPDDSYVGFITRTHICGGTDNVELKLQPNPAVVVHGLKTPVCGSRSGNGGHDSSVSATFLKAPRY